jgi:hypothetical protein
MKAPKRVTRKIARPRKAKPQDGPTTLAMEEFGGYPFRCYNCCVTFDDKKLFCSDLCQAEAHDVRYARRCIADGRYEDQTVRDGITIKDSIRIKIAFILDGGYDKKRQPSKRVRRLVEDRAGGRCEICGRPGEDVHHIDGSSNELANLQFLCKACHNPKILDKLTKLTEESDPGKWAKWEELRERMEAAEPLLLCDAEIWESIWAELMRKRTDAATGQGCLFA